MASNLLAIKIEAKDTLEMSLNNIYDNEKSINRISFSENIITKVVAIYNDKECTYAKVEWMAPVWIDRTQRYELIDFKNPYYEYEFIPNKCLKTNKNLNNISNAIKNIKKDEIRYPSSRDYNIGGNFYSSKKMDICSIKWDESQILFIPNPNIKVKEIYFRDKKYISPDGGTI